MSMSLRLLAAGAAFAFAGATFAATPAATATAKPHTAQQQRMINCNKQATGKKGAERKTFMSTCLKSGGAAAASAPATGAAAAAPSAKQAQQGKMTTCNAEAKSKALKGAERKAFMSACLKSNTAAAS
jgi:hypothetical protein